LNINIEVIATSASILSNEALLVCLINSSLKLDLLIPEFSSHVNVSCFGSHTESDKKCAFNEFMRVMSQNFSIFASSWLGLVTINDEIIGASI